ncbi:MAG: transposase [Gammaproteobacteria bacterium]|nr:transposase [Gammaproteobacteria bacterium]
MPRRGRLHIPGGCYHVIGRGLERRYIFEDAVDKRDFLSRFGDNLRRSDAQCLAWAMMSNHYHLLIRIGVLPLAKLMAPVLGGYAGNYNRRHCRSGYVTQNRFTSILCDEDSYLFELIRYIHLNPLRAEVIDSFAELGRYQWTGHAGILGRFRQKGHKRAQKV